MKKYLTKTISILLFSLFAMSAFAVESDSISTINLDAVSVYSTKETNLKNAPVASTVLGAEKIAQSQISSIRDISVQVPNFFIPDYGSAMSSSPYMRGVGSRSSGQAITLYVDNVPYLEKTAFDFELYDLEKIEVLRGPQGTLYGRNSIGGIVNMYTLSPLNYQGLKVSIIGGNYGYLQGKASYYTLLGKKVGVSLGGYYGKHDGFYINQFTGKKQDAEKTAGGRLKLAWNASQAFKLNYGVDFDYIDQDGFPYGQYNPETKETAQPNFNDPGHYTRKVLNNSLSAKYLYQDLIMTFSLAHQYFDDEMKLDQDFQPLSIFTLQQNQKQNMLNAEAVIRSASNGNYKWLVGVNGFAQKLDLIAPVTFKEDGIKNILQAQLPVGMSIKETEYKIPGAFVYRRNGGALFHQSTFDNLFVDGLSFTLGARLDIENKTQLDYDTHAKMTMLMQKGPKTIEMPAEAKLNGVVDTTFVAFLPKASLKYEWGNQNFVYASVSKGYKSGGFNVQMISDLVTESLRTRQNIEQSAVKAQTMYLPEVSWNYELGIHNSFLDRKLNTEITLFYMDISGMQLTEFVATGAGRRLTNAGTSVSKGVEFSADMRLGGGFGLGVNYGFAHATFTNYKDVKTVQGKPTEVDYKGKFVPYAPQHTVNANLNYTKSLENSFLSQIYGTISYKGIGKIYWHEDNELLQNFYSLIDTKIGVKKNGLGIEIWGKNLLNTDYNAFYFESFGKKFFQTGKPFQFGGKLTLYL